LKGGEYILKKTQLFLALVIALFIASSVGVSAASAATTSNNTTNTTNDNRPGWGFGDHHHHHTGPPGHSVRPGDGDNDKDDHFSSKNFKQFFAELQSVFHNFFSHFG
jgi:hypothetical protein